MAFTSFNQPTKPHAPRNEFDASPIIGDMFNVTHGFRLVTHMDEQHIVPALERVLPQGHRLPVSAAQHQIEVDTSLDPGGMHETASWSRDPHSFVNIEPPNFDCNLLAWPGYQLGTPEDCFNGACDIEQHGWHSAGDQTCIPRSITFEMEHMPNIAEDDSTSTNCNAAQPQAYVNEGVEPHQPAYLSETNSRVCIPRDSSVGDTKTQRTQSERRFVCDQDECTVTCRREPDLQRHKDTIHGLATVIHVCVDKYCDFSNRRKDKMLEHQKSTSHNYRTVNIVQPESMS